MAVAKRNPLIDQLKGISAFLVVWGHVIQYTSMTDMSSVSNWIYTIIYSFHMPLFMFLSGYTAWFSINSKADGDVWPFVKKRTVQLLVPFFSWGIMTAVFINAVELLNNHNIGSCLIWMKNLILHPENGLWFLYVLFLFNLVHFILNKYCPESEKYIWIVVALLYLLPIPDYFGMYNIRRMVPYYYLGVACKLHDYDRVLKEKKMIWAFAFVLIFALFVAVTGDNTIFSLKLINQHIFFNILNLVTKFMIAIAWIAVMVKLTACGKLRPLSAILVELGGVFTRFICDSSIPR